jgi:S1/P1 Nuclease
LPKTAPWHYVDVPLDEPKYDKKWSADDPKKGCVVDKINEFRKTLKDKTKSVEDRWLALKSSGLSVCPEGFEPTTSSSRGYVHILT